MKLANVAAAVKTEKAVELLKQMYGEHRAEANAERYEMVAEGFVKTFGDKDFDFFSAPGRTEIGGNHTDHNHGKVLAGSVHLDCVAAAAPNGTNKVTLISETYNQHLVIDLNDLAPTAKTTGTEVLLKGIFAGLLEKGYKVEGFDAYTTSNVISGAGVSSSAAFEMLVCVIVDHLFNNGEIGVVAYAKAGQYAENKYWLKGSGLLDQLACAVGGMITIDFADIENPQIREIKCNFDEMNHDLVIINTGKGHADLSAEYSAVPNEMKKVAEYFGKEVLEQCDEEALIENLQAIRKYAGDRAVLRAYHFFEENKRVDKEVAALESKDFPTFLNTITASGDSSWKYLQNCYLNETPDEQSITVALTLTKYYLDKIGAGVCRVHGGGFAGVIAAFLPKEHTEGFVAYLDRVMGPGNAHVIHIRPQGAVKVEF
ncbi:MAG: galactokinase family protein [Ruminococcus sp.]|nr:galactokinase family protein [Ruminococcus sp.]